MRRAHVAGVVLAVLCLASVASAHRDRDRDPSHARSATAPPKTIIWTSGAAKLEPVPMTEDDFLRPLPKLPPLPVGPIDRQDPWIAGTLVVGPLRELPLDARDPWNGDTLARSRESLATDTADPWQ